MPISNYIGQTLSEIYRVGIVGIRSREIKEIGGKFPFSQACTDSYNRKLAAKLPVFNNLQGNKKIINYFLFFCDIIIKRDAIDFLS